MSEQELPTVDDTDDTPPSALPDADLFAKLKGWIKKDWMSQAEWRRKAEEWYKFEAGDQWEQSVKDTLKEQRRPFMTFNRVSSTVNAICGMEVNNRLETRYIPRTNEDTGLNDMLTECARWVRDECSAEDEESTLFRDLNICGMGWTGTSMDYEVEKDGLIMEERVDPLEMCWDNSAVKNNLADARRMARVKKMSLDAARAMFPGADDSDFNADWLNRTDRDGDIVDRELARWYDSGIESSKPNEVTIVEMQWYETEDAYQVINPSTGKAEETDKATYDKITKLAKKTGMDIQAAKRKKRIYFRAFLGAVMLENGDSPCDCSFTWKCATAYRNRDKRYWYGVVEQMVDPQRWANAFASSTLYTIMSSGKGIMAERSGFDKPQEAEENWAQADKITWMKEGALSGNAPKVLPKPQTPLHPQIQQMMEMSLNAIREVPGINPEILGQTNRDQPASLEYQRRQSAQAILAPLFDGLRRFRKDQGRLILYFIKTYIPNGRMIRITGDANAQYVAFSKLPDTMEYDVIVDEAPTSPNQKEQTWSFLQTLLPMITQSVQMSLPMWGEILKASPLPAETVQNFLGVAQEQAQQPQPPNPDVMRAQNDQQKTAQDGQKNQVDAELKARELQIKEQEVLLGHKTLEHETARHAMQLQADQVSQQRDAQSANEQAYAANMGPRMAEQVNGVITALPQLIAAMAQQNSQTQQLVAAMVQAIQDSAQAQAAETRNLTMALTAPKEIYNDPVTGMPKGVVTVSLQ